MSHYTSVQTEFKDRDCLIKALVDSGFQEKDILQDVVAQGYVRSDNTQADVVIRKSTLNASGYADMYFKQNEEGNLQMSLDSYDKRKYNNKWVSNLKQRYAYHKVKKEAKKNRYRVTEKTVDGTIQLRLRRW